MDQFNTFKNITRHKHLGGYTVILEKFQFLSVLVEISRTVLIASAVHCSISFDDRIQTSANSDVGIFNAFNDYWKLNDYNGVVRRDLRARVIALGHPRVSPTRSVHELVQLLHRHERGQPCWDDYTDRELVIYSRGKECAVELRKNGKLVSADRLKVINALEHLDTRGCSFDRFRDLPPELRTKVYDYYVAAFPEALHLPVTPPLARTCRIVRRELLPVFYG